MGVLSVIICSIFAAEAYAAVTLSLSVSGTIRYTAKDIGVEIVGTVRVDTIENGTTAEEYMTLSAPVGIVDEYGVFIISGTGENYGAYAQTSNNIVMNTNTDEVHMYLFIRNSGARPIIPVVSPTVESQGLIYNQTNKLFLSSQTNPVALVRAGDTASELNAAIDALTSSDYQAFAENSSINKSETVFVDIVFTIDPNANIGGETTLNYGLTINLMLDIQYVNDENILTVYQQNNSADPQWTKLGYNETLSASALKLETKNPNTLASAYREGLNNNAVLTDFGNNLTYECDDYDTAVVYKDIDYVNVDIATGEIIGKYSDLDYPFEWYGGTVTLDSGTTLASGRTLIQQETFTVDVYTYYPEMYVRRWNVGNYTYLSVTSEDYRQFGFVKIDPFYVGTCETVVYNPDKTAAYNSYGLISRSYLCTLSPLVTGSNARMESAHGCVNNSGFPTNFATTQANMLALTDNLTHAWEDYASANPDMAQYTTDIIHGIGGNDWHEFVYAILYLIKYANNNSQEVVGYGSSFTNSVYKSFVGDSTVCTIESEKVGGTIGMYDSSKNANSGTFSGAKFNSAHMAYGFDCTTPYYCPDFLGYNNGTKRIMRDGYVGTNKYTSVCCLGKFNPWGNIWTWICGAIVALDSGVGYCFVQFDDYDTTNYYLTNSSTLSFANKADALTAMGYQKVTYGIPTTANYYRYLGVSEALSTNTPTVNAMLTLIGLPTSASSTATATTGLCDQLTTRNSTSTEVFGVCVGNATDTNTAAGIFSYSIRQQIVNTWQNIGFRTMLIS